MWLPSNVWQYCIYAYIIYGGTAGTAGMASTHTMSAGDLWWCSWECRHDVPTHYVCWRLMKVQLGVPPWRPHTVCLLETYEGAARTAGMASPHSIDLWRCSWDCRHGVPTQYVCCRLMKVELWLTTRRPPTLCLLDTYESAGGTACIAWRPHTLCLLKTYEVQLGLPA